MDTLLDGDDRMDTLLGGDIPIDGDDRMNILLGGDRPIEDDGTRYKEIKDVD